MRKLAILSLCFVLVLAVFAYSAAADISVTNSFDKDTATFGGSNQKASNPNLDNDDNDYHVYVDGAVSVRNNGTTSVTIDGMNINYKMGFAVADLNITLKQGATLTANSTGSVTLEARISEKLDAVDSKQNAIGFNVADIELKSGSTIVATFSAYMQRENQLELDKVKVEVGASKDALDSSTTVNEDGDKVDEVKPGDWVKLTVFAENKYSDSDDVDIDADDGRWTIGGDIDEDEDIDFGDISADSKDDMDFSFKVDDDVDDGSEDFLIYVFGKDEFDAKHGQRINAEFKVEKKKNEIKIDSMTATPTKVKCGELVTVKVKVVNIGKKDEDEATVRISNSVLEIDDISTVFNLDKGDDTIKIFDFVIPSDAETGSKAFTVTANYDFDKETDRETFNIDIESCEADTSGDTSGDTSDNQNDTTDDTPVPQAVTGGTTTAEPTSGSTGPTPITTVSSSRGGFRDSTVYILLLILAIVVVVMAGAFFIAKTLIVR